MKTKTFTSTRITFFVLSLCWLGIRNGSAAVVSQALRLEQFDPPHGGPAGSDAQVSPNVLGCGGWGQFLALQDDGKLKFATGTLGSVFAWFTVEQGERVDAAFVLGNPPFGTRGPNSIFFGDVLAPETDGTWLFAWWSTDRSFNYDPGPNDCYGWLRLGVSEGNLIIVDDAAEVGGAGIYAGTRIAVPEPSAPATLAGALILVSTRRRRNLSAGAVMAHQRQLLGHRQHSGHP